MTYWFMHTVGTGDAGKEATRDELADAIKSIIASKEGLSLSTLTAHPLLLAALGAATPEEALEELTRLVKELPGPPLNPLIMKAFRAGLAIDFPAGEGSEDRVRRMTASKEKETAYVPKSPRQVRRYMEEGAKLLAAAIRALPHNQPAPTPPSPADIVMAKLQEDSGDTSYDITVTAPPRPVEPHVPRRSRRLWLIGGGIAATVVLLWAVVYAIVKNTDEKPTTMPPTGSTAPAPDPVLMAKYDGHDPRGSEPDGSLGIRCADPPPSEAVEGTSTPPVIGPEGKQVGVLHLRRSPSCSTIWARVVWNDDLEATYKVPDGWTLHVVVHRPSTHTVVDATEPEAGKPPNATPIPYGLSRMLTSQPGCIFAEAYFTKDALRTYTATTSCGS